MLLPNLLKKQYCLLVLVSEVCHQDTVYLLEPLPLLT